jgi:plastocyanin
MKPDPTFKNRPFGAIGKPTTLILFINHEHQSLRRKMLPMKIRLLLLPSLLLGASLLAACSGTTNSTSPQAITVQASGMAYHPATLEVVAGQPVKLTFENMDVVDHDLSIQEFPMSMMGPTQEAVVGHDMGGVMAEPELHMAALTNKTAVLEFTPSEPGTYEYFCTVAGHKEAGMHGTLRVTATAP